MRQGLLAAVSVVFGVACSSSTSSDASTDYGANFAGIWVGDFTESDATGDNVGSFEAALNIEETSRNFLKINNLCIQNQGPQVMATSASEFSGSPGYVCPEVGDEECGSAIVTWVSLSGKLTGSTLAFTAHLSVARCGRNDLYTAVMNDGAREFP